MGLITGDDGDGLVVSTLGGSPCELRNIEQLFANNVAVIGDLSGGRAIVRHNFAHPLIKADVNQTTPHTYTAVQIEGGYIQRVDNTVNGYATNDVFPTSTDLLAAMPDALPGNSFPLITANDTFYNSPLRIAPSDGTFSTMPYRDASNATMINAGNRLGCQFYLKSMPLGGEPAHVIINPTGTTNFVTAVGRIKDIGLAAQQFVEFTNIGGNAAVASMQPGGNGKVTDLVINYQGSSGFTGTPGGTITFGFGYMVDLYNTINYRETPIVTWTNNEIEGTFPVAIANAGLLNNIATLDTYSIWCRCSDPLTTGGVTVSMRYQLG
jgi:hypothetical protein